MKTIKLLLAFAILSFGFSSCKKTETNTTEDQQVSPSETARIVTSYIKDKNASLNFSRVSSGFDVDDLLNYDFCFTFVYPITLSYNNGTTVVVNNSAELLQVAQGMTQNLYINGIYFPFDVQMADGSIQTVNNETEFSTVIHSCDTDNDGSPNYQDTDDDNDGISDDTEDLNGNGYCGDDDTDGDGVPNYQDTDDDGDGIDTTDEDLNHDGDPTNDDSDGDGVPNCQDQDDDNDGVPTADEDHDHNGNVADDDSDGDGTPDYLDTDSDNDGIDDGNDSDADGDGTDDDQENDHNGNDD